MKTSNLLIPTLKEAPKEAEIISHRLMLRAGLIRQQSAGIYSLLPLGLKIIKKLEALVREEMNASGAQELALPTITTAELWKKSGRWDHYGKELLRLKDRHERDYCYGPTHEEAITALISSCVDSYKSLPLTVYQLTAKFRDEIRPRFGLMRGREFLMKDAYSFSLTTEELDKTYTNMQKAYRNIFTRAGLSFIEANADTGNIGGSESTEFLLIADTGEDEILVCDHTAINSEVKDQETCPHGCEWQIKRGIEVGHIFKLGNKYSQSMDAKVLDQNGKPQHFIMGCYGIGISRTVQAAIEQNHDEKGIVWPKALAPFEIAILIASTKDPDLVEKGNAIYQDLLAKNIDVLLDDRDTSIGFKFKDADLIGYPLQLVIGKTYKETGVLELINRKTGDKIPISDAEGIQKILSVLNDV